MIRVLDIFSGIGGFSLGLESTGHFRAIGFCEIEPFPREVLRKHWPGVPIWEDVRELTAESLGGLRPDAIVGGFPCQDISVAGKGEGIEGSRSGLWSEFARLVVELRPSWVLAENVGALRTRGIDRVCSDLEAEGYAVWPLVVGAWAVGAPHRRDRVWIVAHRNSAGQGGRRGCCLLDRERQTPGHDADRRGERPVGEPTGSGLEGQRADAGQPQESQPRDASLRWPARPGEEQHEWEEPRLVGYARRERPELEPQDGAPRPAATPTGRCSSRSPELPLGSSTHGLPERLAQRWNRESLKAVGNAVVPQVVAVIGQAIAEAEQEFVK